MAVNPIQSPSPPDQTAPATVSPAVSTADGKGKIAPFNDSDQPSFSDLLDIINPLQHIPIINTIYRQLTGDHEGAVADLVGGTLWGGFIGLGAAMVNLAVEDQTGKDVGDNVVALFTGDDKPTAVAADQAKPATGQSAASQPTTTPAEADAPPPPTAAPVESVTTAPLSATTANATTSDGPVRAGDYLVFGAVSGSGNSRPGGQRVASNASVTAAGSRSAASNTTAPQMAAADTTGAPRQQGDFLVFGAAGSPAATKLPDVTVAPLAAPQAATATSGTLSGTTPDPTTETPPPSPSSQAMPMATSGDQTHLRPIPARRGPITPPNALPMPTTGPAAVPGHAAVVGASQASGTSAPATSPWFNGAFNDAMDKYQRAARLKDGDTDTAPISIIPAATPAANAAAPLN
jgi:hypothetical protein